MRDQSRGEQIWPCPHDRLDTAAAGTYDDGLVTHVPTSELGSMPAESASISEGEEPPVPIGRWFLRQPVLRGHASSELSPPVRQHVGVWERDHDVTAPNAAQLRERIVDPVHVLQDVERDHDLGAVIGEWDPFAQVGHDIGRGV
jgi:hypothetical protein